MLFAVLLCLGASVSAGAPPPEPEVRPKLVTAVQVDGWLEIWKRRMRLDEWKVEVRIVRATELKPETLGNLKWNLSNRTAVIKVLNPLDYDLPAAEIPEDIEYTIVHELVHLQLAVLPRDLNRKDVEETVVNKMADALMSLDKGPGFRARSTPVPKTPGKAGEPEVAGRTTSQPR